MDVTLVNFLLQNIGIPMIAQIVKVYKDNHGGTLPTSEQVISAFVDDWQNLVKQGEDWLASHPAK